MTNLKSLFLLIVIILFPTLACFGNNSQVATTNSMSAATASATVTNNAIKSNIKATAAITNNGTNKSIANGVDKSAAIIYLSGKKWDFKCTSGQNSGKWSKIDVPCNWELQGFGDYTYGRYYTVKGQKPSSEEGFYKTTFQLPNDKTTSQLSNSGSRITLWFDGVMTDTEVKVNGKVVGPIHQGGFYRFSYDITDFVKPGSNKLEVHVWKESHNKSVNAAERKADWWLFGGIYRPVWLEITPNECISHFAVDAKADGSMAVDVTLQGNTAGYSLQGKIKKVVTAESAKEIGGNLEQNLGTLYKVRDGSGKADDKNKINKVSENKATSTCKFTIATKVEGIETWDPEHPNLYDLTLTLVDKNNQEVFSKTERIGFRTIEVREHDGIYINGTKIIARGVNRHTFWPTTGRTTTKEQSINDARLIKEMNMNAVRSHYPPDTHFLDACDSLGILYIDELSGWQNAVDDTIASRILPEMINRDVNHPCIFLWSNGNEGGFNYSIDDKFAKFDPQHRIVIHPWADWGKIDVHHYPAYLTGVGRFNNGDKIFMPTETMHAMYDQGGGAALNDFWTRWEESPLFAGGFIWCFCDESVMRTDRGGVLDSDGSNAPDGVLGPYREKEGSYYSIREIWSPIKIMPFRITRNFDGKILVKNKYLFSNLEGGKLILNNSDEVVLPDIAPGEVRSVKLPLKNILDKDFLTITAVGPQGDTVCTTSYPITTPSEYLHRTFDSQLADAPVTMLLAYAEKDNDAVTLTNGNLSVKFSNLNGQIVSIVKNDQELPLKNGPVGVGLQMKYSPEKSYTSIERDADGKEVAVFVAKYQGAVDSIVWKLYDEERLSMNALLLNRFDGGDGFDGTVKDANVKNYGLTFSYPESECTGMTWMGRGPYRVWKNRISGTNFGIWHKDYNNTITGEVRPDGGKQIYPEFKGYHANIYWANIESKEHPIKVYSGTENLFMCLFTPQEPKSLANGKNTMQEFPNGDISFLLDIQAIQSFKPIEHQGPSSQPGIIRINKGDEGLHINLLFQF